MSNNVKTNDENNTPLNEAELRKLVKANVDCLREDKALFEGLVMHHMRALREHIVQPCSTVGFGDFGLRIDVDIRATEDHDVAVSLSVNGGTWQSHGTTLNVKASPFKGDDALQRCQGVAISELTIGCLADLKLNREQAQEYIDALTYLFMFANVVCDVDSSLALTFIDKPFAEEQKIRAAA